MSATKLAEQGFLGPLAFLVCGFPKKLRRERLLLMLVAHVDDSGITDKNDNPVMVLAGYLARAEAWNEFAEKWRDILSEHPRVGFIRMAQAHRLRGEFREHSKKQRDAKVAKLQNAIMETSPIAVACVLWWQDFRDFKKMFSSPIQAYTIMFNNMIWNLMEVMKQKFPGEQLEIIFDDQGALGTRAASLNDKLTLGLSKRYRRILAGRPVHRSDEHVLPLQAADMLAWNLRRSASADSIDNLPPFIRDLPITFDVLSAERLARIHSYAVELKINFPNIDSVYSKNEIKDIRNKFLGFDPDKDEIRDDDKES